MVTDEITETVNVDTQSRYELKEKSEEPGLLENSILVHGFSGNVNTGNPVMMESINLEKIIKEGFISTPSKRALTEQEQARYQTEAPFDMDRITFHVWKGDDKDTTHYINNAFFAAPPSALEGSVLHEDPAWAGRAIAAFHNDGLEIPFERGILFCSPDYAIQFEQSLNNLAKRSGLEFGQYMQKHVVILPEATFSNAKKLWETVTNHISPSKGVTAAIVPTGQLDFSNGINFAKSLSTKPVVSKEQLGDGHILEAGGFGIELILSIKSEAERNLQHLESITANMDSDPFQIEALRRKPDWFKLLDLMNKINPSLTEELNNLRNTYDQIRAKALVENNDLLKLRYPNAQKSGRAFSPPNF